MPKLKVIPPADAPEAARAAAADFSLDVVGRLYVLHAPECTSMAERAKAAERIREPLEEAHKDGTPFSWVVLPHGWSIELHEVDGA